MPLIPKPFERTISRKESSKNASVVDEKRSGGYHKQLVRLAKSSLLPAAARSTHAVQLTGFRRRAAINLL